MRESTSLVARVEAELRLRERLVLVELALERAGRELERWRQELER
jgi:hypothetical protein